MLFLYLRQSIELCNGLAVDNKAIRIFYLVDAYNSCVEIIGA